MLRQVHRRSNKNVFVLVAMAFFAIVSLVVMPKSYKGRSSWFCVTSTRGVSSESQLRFNNISGHTGFTSKSVLKRDNEKGDVNLERIEAGLATARELIREATKLNQTSPLEDADYVPNGDIYRNAYAFHRSYLLMESLFKIFVYEEGEPPMFHNEEAHVYFLPFSVVMIIEYLFHPVIRDKAVLQLTVVDYVRVISNKYPFWNRSLGADHVMLSCHDWEPRATWYVQQLYFVAIRVLCNANTSEHFNPKKDASFPEINLVTGEITGLIGGLQDECMVESDHCFSNTGKKKMKIYWFTKNFPRTLPTQAC
ncbi:hypothetical protein ACLB2K_067313 [Fragaria x ananassa]